MAEADREAAVNAAKRARIPVGEWLTTAIREAIEAERTPRAVRAEPEPERMPASYAAPYAAPSPPQNPYQEAAHLAALLPALATPSGRSAAEIALRKAVIEEVDRVRMTRRHTAVAGPE